MGKTIWVVDIESLENRYTAQWRKNIPEIFARETGLEIKTISGTDYDGMTEGGFFDFTKTMKYKAEQQIKISEMLSSGEIKDGDYIFYTDAFTPTVQAVQYMINMTDRDIKQYGYIHTNSFDETDILGLKGNNHWAQHFERSMFECLERVYVATEYHRNHLLENFKEYEDKFIVSGCPTDLDELNKYSNIEKEKIILFPHRINEDKQPELFEQMKEFFPDYEFVYSQSEPRTKDEFYKLIAKSEIVACFSLHENYGISMIESLFLGCKLFAPNDKSYKEMYAKELLYPRMLEKDIGQFSTWFKGLLKDEKLDSYLEKSKDNIKEHYCSFTKACEELR